MQLETKQLILRPWEQADAEELYCLARDPKVGPAAGWMVHTSVENSCEIIRTVLCAPETYAVVLRQSGRIIGSIGEFSSDAQVCANGAPELGYWLGSAYWGRGLMAEAIQAMLSRCFDDFGADTVWCSHFDGNDNSRRVQEKCGFLYHHTERDTRWLAASGKQILHYNCLTRAQYQAMRGDTGKRPYKVLLTGFDPFGGEVTNPAYEAVKLLPGTVCGARIIKQELPTVFSQSGHTLCSAIEQNEPDLVICVGQAGGSSGLLIERVAVNLRDARIADNAGNQPCDKPVVQGGPAAYFTKLPAKNIVSTIRAAGIPAYLSYSAGSYVCNDVFYTLMHLIETERPALTGGFIHVPYSSAQAAQKPSGTPGMSLDMIAQGLSCAVGQTLQTMSDS